jgi:flagellar M-ring protein FliF
MPAGVLKKMSVSVLVDQDVRWDKEGSAYKKVLIPPSPEKIKVIRDLVAGVTGLVDSRGDQLIVETLPFENTLQLEPPNSQAPVTAAPPVPTPASPIEFWLRLDRKKQIIAGTSAGGGLVLFAVMVFLLRRRKTVRKATAVSVPGELAGARSGPEGIEGPQHAKLEDEFEHRLAERDAQQQKLDAQTLQALKLAPVINKTSEVLAKHLRERVSKEGEMSAQILRTWIREEVDD